MAMEWYIKEIGWGRMALRTICCTLVAFLSVAMVGLLGLYLHSGTTLSSMATLLMD